MSLSLVQSRALLGLEAAAGHGRGASGQRPAQLHAGGPGRHRGQGSARARALRDAELRAWNSRTTSASRSTWRRPTCPRTRAASTCRSRWASWRPAARSTRRAWPATSSPASCRCRANCGPVRGALAMAWRCTRRRRARAGAAARQRRRGRAGARRQVVRRARTCWTWCGSSCRGDGAEPGAGWARLASRLAPARPRRHPDLARRQGPGRRQARAGDRRGGRAQPADGRPAGLRQVDAGAALRRPAAADERGRSAGERRASPAWPGASRCERWARAADAAARTTRPARWPWWAAARRRGRARSRWRTHRTWSVAVRRRDQHPGAVTRRHEHRVRVARPHVPCAVSRLQAPAQHQTDAATDRAPEDAKGLEQGAEGHQDQRRHGRRWRRRAEERCQQRPQHDPRDGGIAPAKPRGERDPARHLVRQRSERRGHVVVGTAVRPPLALPAAGRRAAPWRVSACSWADPRRAARGPRARLRAARAPARR